MPRPYPIAALQRDLVPFSTAQLLKTTPAILSSPSGLDCIRYRQHEVPALLKRLTTTAWCYDCVMHEADKLEEAEILSEANGVCRRRPQGAPEHDLSTSLSASRSVLQFASKEATFRSAGQAWYDSQVTSNPAVNFFRRRRLSIRAEPIRPIKEIQVHIEETLHVDIAAEAVVIRNGSVLPSEPQRQASPLLEGTHRPYPSKVTMLEAYRFSEWNGTEDVPTLCRMYLVQLHKIVTDSQSKGFLTL